MSKSSQSSTMELHQELERLSAKVATVRETLTHLNNEVVDAQKRRHNIAEEVKIETEQLLEQRARELTAVEDEAKDQIKNATQQLVPLRGHLAILRQEKVELQADLDSLAAEKSTTLDEVDTYNTKITTLNRSIEAKERQLLSVEDRVSSLEPRIGQLLVQEATLVESIKDLESKKAMLAEESGKFSVEYQERRTRLELEVADMLKKQETLNIAQSNMHKQYEQMSEDIALRTRALDDRDEVLKRREHKVSGDEARVAQNANLLQL